MKKTLSLFAVFALITNFTFAQTIIFEEGFESGTFPPADWEIESNVTASTWENSIGFTAGTITIEPVDGLNFARVNWQTGLDQDEWLITPSIDFTGYEGGELTFWFNGSYYWSVDDPKCTLKLHSKIGTGAWTVLWNVVEDTSFVSTSINWNWLLATVSLAQFEGESNVKFAWVYTGNDGAAFSIDAVKIKATPASAINELKANVSISPNPTNGIINVSSDKNYTVDVIDITGRIISSTEMMNNRVSIDISENPVGMYFVRLNSEEGTAVYKVIKD